MNRTRFRRGFSLVEIVVATALLVFLISTGFMAWRSIMQSSVSSRIQSKVNDKLNTIRAMIQNEAVENFDTMTETNRDRTGFIDPDIRIVSTIAPVNPDDRTRLVTLQATYNINPANTDTKTVTFKISNILGGISGSSIRVRVLSRQSNTPIANILVSAPGKTVPLVSGLTDINGACRLYGVLESSPTMRVTIDGEGVNSYPQPPFPAPGYPTYKKYVNAFNIQNGEQRDLGDHVFVRPANATVRVLDAATNLPVPNVEVRLNPQAGEVPTGTCNFGGPTGYLCWMGGGFSNGFSGTTGADGRVTFTNLLEGPYYPLVVGNGVYAAADKIGTSPGNNPSRNPQCGLVSEATANCGDSYTIRKGSLKVSVKEVVYQDDGTYVFKGPMAVGNTVQFSLNNDFSYLYNPNNLTRVTGFQWNNSLARNLVTSGVAMHTGQLDNNGEYVFNFIAPRIVNSSHTMPSSTGAERQGIEGTFLLGYFHNEPPFLAQVTPAPYLPVAVRNIGKDATKPQFVVAFSNFLNIPIIKTLPSNSVISDYTKVLFTNGLTTSNADFEIGVLKYQTELMARARGVIRGTGANAITVNSFVSSAVRIREGNGSDFGSSAISFNSTLGAFYAQSGKWSVTVSSPDSMPGTFKHIFDFPDLLPTLDMDRQGFEFQAIPSTPTANPSTNFYLPVIVYSKDSNGNPIELLSPSFPTAQVNLTFRYWQSGNQTEPPATPAVISNGELQMLNPRTSYTNDEWTGIIPAQALQPGVVTTFPDFNNAIRSSTRRTYFITSSSNNQLDFVPQFAGMGYVHSYNGVRYQPLGLPQTGNYMRFAQRAITHLHGQVRTVGGAGIGGATVNLSGHGFAAMPTTTDSNGMFHFPPTGGESNTFSFSLTNVQHNLTIRATHPNYVSSGDIGLVTGMPIANPFVVNLTLNASGSGSGW